MKKIFLIIVPLLISIFAVFYIYNRLEECGWKECNADGSECSDHRAWLLPDEKLQFVENKSFSCQK
jgi:hypothetical protein